MSASQISSAAAKKVHCMIAAAKEAAVKLPSAGVAEKKECPTSLNLHEKSSTAGSAIGASATQSTANQLLGASGLLTALVFPFAPTNKHVIKEAVDKLVKTEHTQDRNEDLKASRSKTSILTVINLENLANLAISQKSLPLIKLPAVAALAEKIEKKPLQPAALARA